MRSRLLFLYEVPEDGGGAPPPAEEAPVEAPVEETFSVSREDWEQTVGYLRQTAPLLQYVASQMQNGSAPNDPAPQPTPAVEFDPWEPSSVEAYVQAQIEQRLAETIGPYQHVINTVAAEEGERAAKEALEGIWYEFGSPETPAVFDHDLAVMIAAGHMADPNADPDLALRGGARYAMDLEARIRADERARYQAELEGLKNTPSDLRAGGAAATEGYEVPTGPSRYRDVVENVLARRAQARI